MFSNLNRAVGLYYLSPSNYNVGQKLAVADFAATLWPMWGWEKCGGDKAETQ